MSKNLFWVCAVTALAASTSIAAHDDAEEHQIFAKVSCERSDASDTLVFEDDILACEECGGTCGEGDEECQKEEGALFVADDESDEEENLVADSDDEEDNFIVDSEEDEDQLIARSDEEEDNIVVDSDEDDEDSLIA